MCRYIQGARIVCGSIVWLWLWVMPAGAQDAADLPSCTTRAGWNWEPRVDPLHFCYETLVSDDEQGEMPYTGLAFAPDGTLYAARPLTGQVVRITDSDGDSLPDAEQALDYTFQRPNVLAFHAASSALYIAGGTTLYRLDHATQNVTVLAADLPVAPAGWVSGLLAADDALYMGIPAACALCEPQPEQGAILRMALDGSQRKIVALGLRNPAALAQHDGRIYVGDSAPLMLDRRFLDELNAFALDAAEIADFGWPVCLLHDDSEACADIQAPLLRFETGSTPLALLPYGGDDAAFPHLQGQMLIVLAGVANRAEIRGYEVLSVDLSQAPPVLQTILPFDEVTAPSPPISYNGIGYDSPSATLLNQRAVGVYPHHFYGAAISPQGWLTFSIGGGSIAMLRPGDWRCVWVDGVRRCQNLHNP